ncbi:MAG: adenylate/guanylate cyclase domain-containing protein [Planctomycetes bacterium]|nr:adenylate/guanylate cyclase domain-containing protein [Planctomycetota bacterium]
MLRIVVANRNEREQVEHGNGPIEFGRGPKRQIARCVIHDPFVSNDQLRVEPLPGRRVRLDNLSRRTAITLADGSSIATGQARDVSLPVRLSVGETVIDIGPDAVAEIDRGSLQTIDRPVCHSQVAQSVSSSARLGNAPSSEQLARWFETLLGVQKAAACSSAFYEQTARAVVELVGLDSGMVLLRRGDAWHIAAQHLVGASHEAKFSCSIMNYLVNERRTFFQDVASRPPATSLAGVTAVVAAPILDDSDQVIGAVYGSRFTSRDGVGVEIRPLEAQLVQLLSAAVAAGLARMKSEAEAVRRHVQFEQFFTPILARELDRDPTLLEGRDREVTTLFSDIRGFSHLSERLSPRDTCQLVRDVMERLTTRVRQYEGVVVDYVGDGLLAMWNAPLDQPDHASRACRAALAMLAELPEINATWREKVGASLRLGIGVNTGPALVGNTGSQQKLKYGPLGHTVNLGSRVEGATKQLGVPVLITGSTRALLGPSFATRRLFRVRVVGMAEAVDLYELHGETATPEWTERRDSYESALSCYESGCWAQAYQELYSTLAGQKGNYDVPSLTLVEHIVRCLKNPPEQFDPVLELSSK